MNNFSELELRELRVELASIEDDFTELGEIFGLEDIDASSAESDELSLLNQELEGTEIDNFHRPSAGELSLMSVIEGDFDQQSLEMQGFFGNVKRRLEKLLKSRAAKLIRKIVSLVRKYSKLKSCIPAVTKAVVFFKAGKYRQALSAAWSAYKCIKKHL